MNARNPIPIQVVNRSGGRLRPADHFERAAFAAFKAATTRQFGGADETAKALFPGDDISWRVLVHPNGRTGPEWVQRAAVSGATTSDPSWAGAIAQAAPGEFFASLSPISAAARLINLGARVSLDGLNSIVIPRRSTVPAADVAWVGEGVPIPAKRLTVSTTEIGPGKKLAVLSTFTRELARRSAAQEIVIQALREDAAASLDASVFSTQAANAVRPAGLLFGVTATTATAGGGLDAMEADLVKLATAVATRGGSGALIFVTNPTQAASIAIRRPDLTFPVLATPGVAAGTIIALDPSAFVSAFGTDADIAASIEATIHLEDSAAAHIGTTGTPNVTAAPTASMFQTASVVVRAMVDAAFAMRAPAIAYVSSATW